MTGKFNRRGFLRRFIVCLTLFAGFSSALFPQESDTESILNEVVNLLSAKDFSSALVLFDNMEPETRESAEILIMRASIYNAAGKPAEAKKLAEKVLAARSDNTDALMILADTAALENKERDRRNFLERVIRADPKHVRALTDLANLSLGNQSLTVAASYFDRALAAEPENGEALVGRAVVYRYNREPRRAEQLLNRAANLYPDWSRPLHERARLYKGAGFYNDALEDLDSAIRLDKDNYWILVDRGQVLVDLDRKEEALKDFNRAIEIDPDVFLAYVYSASIKEEFGDNAGAEKDYVKLASLKPDYYFAFEAIGLLNMREKKWAKARDAFLDAYRQAPKEYTYALLASVCWMRAGRQTDPKQFLAQVLRAASRDSLEYAVLKLFHDLSGDADVAAKIAKEVNVYTKARMLFFLASYYDIRGSRTLADMYYLMVQELDAAACIEWRLNEWILAERGLGIRVLQ